MEVETIESKSIKGLRIRTSSTQEMSAETGQIPGLWQLFNNNVGLGSDSDGRVYGVYFDYASDTNAEFSVIAGTDELNAESLLNLETVDIESGKYAVFHAKGDMSKIVIETWGEVWKYFTQQNVEYKRRYTTDFECYEKDDELKIYIAIE